MLYIALLLIIDQASKYFFYDLSYYANSIFLFQPTLNEGISWSMPVGLVLVIPITIIFILILGWFRRTGYIDEWSFVFLIAGTIGNLIDRILYDGVRDWIWLGRGPVFNIADVLINLGLIIYIYKHFIKQKK